MTITPFRALLLFLAATSVPAALVAGQRQGLDPALLTKPPTDSWPTYHGDFTGRRYSTLTQITADNVKSLQLAWVYRLNTSRALANIGGGYTSSKETMLDHAGQQCSIFESAPAFVTY